MNFYTTTGIGIGTEVACRQGPDLRVCSLVSFHTAASLPSGVHILECLPCSLLARDTSSYQWLVPPGVTVEKREPLRVIPVIEFTLQEYVCTFEGHTSHTSSKDA